MDPHPSSQACSVLPHRSIVHRLLRGFVGHTWSSPSPLAFPVPLFRGLLSVSLVFLGFVNDRIQSITESSGKQFVNHLGTDHGFRIVFRNMEIAMDQHTG